MRHLDSCLKEIDTEVSTLVADKEHDDNHIHDKHSVALNLSLNSTATSTVNNDQDENNNGTDDNTTFESSSSFPSITSEQQSHHHDKVVETTSSSSSSSTFKRTKSHNNNNNDKHNEKTDESISIGLTPLKKPRLRLNDEKHIKMVTILLLFSV